VGAGRSDCGPVPVGGIARRILFAWYFNDVNLLLSSYITGDSRIMFRRDIRERVRTIAPFLRLDHDPYLVISDGRLFWMQDTYTTSDYFPYAQPARCGFASGSLCASSGHSLSTTARISSEITVTFSISSMYLCNRRKSAGVMILPSTTRGE
jgi:uncharacterized membrane protein (UPF0182 family)